MCDRAVIYARFSSSKQQEQSIDGQIRYCTQYAEQRGYQIVDTYADRAISGRTDERPEFQRMIADAKKHKFNYIIVWKLDRFSRDRYASAMYKHELKKHGVKVLSATEGIGEGDESVILEAILEAMAEMYVTQLSQNVKRGMKESALGGKCATGTPPLGYRFENKQMVICPEEAVIVRRIYEEYAAGKRKSDIVEDLNREGFRTRTGGQFKLNSFSTILKNKKYIGLYHFDGIEVVGGCPAIIDRELFDKCQVRLEANRRMPGRRPKIEYQLKGKLFCGYCGSSMIGDAGTGKKGKRFSYYSCSKKKNHGAGSCSKRRERKDFIEWYIVEQCLEYILEPSRLQYVAERVVEEYDKSYSIDELNELKAQRARYEREFEKLTDSLINTTNARMIERINTKADELEARIAGVESDIASMEVGRKVRLTVEEVTAWLQGFCDGDPTDEDFRKRIIDVLINAVYLYDDKVVIYFNIRDGKQISYIEMLEDLEESEMDSGVRVSTQMAHH